MFFSPFSIAITTLGEEIANLSAFRTFVRFVLVWFCRFPLLLGVWEGLQFVIMVLPGFSLTFFVFLLLWSQCYKVFVLDSAEREICPANKSQITNNCQFFLAKHV